jgi:hypothetical protein
MHQRELDSRIHPALQPEQVFSPRPWSTLSESELSAPALTFPPPLGVLRLPADTPQMTIKRLVVPVPVSDLDEATLGRRVWEVVLAADLQVLLLARVDRPDEELWVRRRLATLGALLRRRNGGVDVSIVHERTWPQALRRACQMGDVVLCPTADGLDKNGLSPLADRVVGELRLPAYVLDDLSLNLVDRPRFHLPGILSWVALLSLLVAFGVVQSQVVIQVHGWVQSMLLLMTVGLELAALWFVESMVGSWR